ncbi:MAG: class GN sortase [Xanthomonadales bacterium]|nr:class GN sortase [Xanthomonadales bacterium]
MDATTLPRRAPRRRLGLRQGIAVALALCAAGIGAQPAWLQTKAALAQVLLQSAWSESRSSGEAVKPWPWADTHPVARLSVPRLAVDQIVLAGDAGRVLAFGPGWAEASATPGSHGHSVISGHRDNHFAFLRLINEGDRVLVETAEGQRAYRVTAQQVVDSRKQRIALDGGDTMTLVTCWPFDSITAGGPKRYVVTAVPEGSALAIAASARDLHAEAVAVL